MALSITPGVNEWAKQLGAFPIIFKGYDDNGNQCIGNHLSIQYAMTYDGSEPDITNMTEVYSDASGIIALTITAPCVITLYGSHSRDINDASKGIITQEIAVNHHITFEPIIIDITVGYTGSDLFVSDTFSKNDLLIKARLNDGSIKIINPNDCEIKNDDYLVYKIGDNTKTLLYEDLLLDTVFAVDFIIVGLPKLLALDAEYTGEILPIGSRIYSDEVLVTGVFLVATDTREIIRLSPTEWEFLDFPVITDTNNGVFKIQYQNLITQITVPYTNVSSLRLNVWYEGAKIEVGKSYDEEDVVIYVIYPDGKRIRVGHEKCQISSIFVTEIGWNWYTVIYSEGQETATQEFAVPGVILKDYIDLSFTVTYIDKETGEEIDMTKEFEDYLRLENTLLMSWSQFLSKVNNLQKYGLYRVIVPKLSGLSDKYDMEWEVLCINETTLKANIRTIYNEEE